jgi:tRNA G10  N-methylase Trm11
MSTFFAFGSHPALSLAEVQAVFPATDVRMVGNAGLSATDIDPVTCVERLGGIVKAGRILLDLKPDQDLVEALVELIRTHPKARKIVFSLTIFGKQGNISSKLPIELKRKLQEEGTPARWFADSDGQVTPAAVKKAGLIEDGYDICVFSEADRISIGFTEAVQDPDAWTLRDMGRPFRDAENGMLPPKLARLLVNLAGADTNRHLLDPFCGSGTIPMEAALMGYRRITGSDNDPQQVKDTEGNMRWLADRGLIPYETLKDLRFVVSAAAYAHTRVSAPVEVIVTEGYLGTPLRGNESQTWLEEEAQAIEKIWRDALPTFAKLQPSGGVLVGVWPILTSHQGRAAVEAQEAAKTAGYVFSGPKDLIYARPEQFVQRRIVVLHKK